MFEISTTFALIGLVIRGGWAWHMSAWRNPFSNKKNLNITDSAFSVIVCFKNEEENADIIIESILDQNHTKFELILVDDGSTDSTLERLNYWGRKESRIKIVRVKNSRKGKKDALSAGVKSAKHSVIVCTDADCEPASRDWLAKMGGGAEDVWDVKLGISLPKAGRGILGVMQMFEAERIAQKYIGMAEGRRPYMGVGRNIAFTRRAWDGVNGVADHSDIASGDDDLFVQDVKKAGMRIATETSLGSRCDSVWPNSWRKWHSQILRHLSTAVKYNKTSLLFLSIPIISGLLLYGGCAIVIFTGLSNEHNVIHSSVWIVTYVLVINSSVRILTFSAFLCRIGRPRYDAILLVFEPLTILLRQLVGIQGLIAKPKLWK